MQSVFIELTKYIFAFLMAFYVLSAYRGAIIHKEEKEKRNIYPAVYYNIRDTFSWILCVVSYER